MITDIIKELQKDNYYGGGECIEIAKGKNEYITTFKDFKRKIKRIWQSRKR